MTKRCENELIIIVKEIVADLMESIKLKKKQKLIKNLKIFMILLLVKVI